MVDQFNYTQNSHSIQMNTNIQFNKHSNSSYSQLTIKFLDGTTHVSKPTDAFLKPKDKQGRISSPSQKDWTELAESIIGSKEYVSVIVS